MPARWREVSMPQFTLVSKAGQATNKYKKLLPEDEFLVQSADTPNKY